MSEQELYRMYIAAQRLGNKEVIAKMLAEGFRPDRFRLMELAKEDEMVREVLFNKKIKIKIDTGHVSGHVYGEFPYYDEQQRRIIEGSYGYYPKSGYFAKALMGEGVIKDEVHGSRRASEQLPRQEVTLALTEESWIHLAHWFSKKDKEKNLYIFVGKNCANFIDMALKEAGYEDGLLDKFDPSKIQQLDFGLIKFDITQYFRYDKREIYQPHAQIPIMESRSEEIQSGMAAYLEKQAKQQRIKSNKKSHSNHVNAFFDKYHNADFYQAQFKDKSFLTIEDMVWLIRNRAPGLEKRIYSVFMDVFAQASQKTQDKFSGSSRSFVEYMVRTLALDPKSLDPELQSLLSSIKVECHEDEIPPSVFMDALDALKKIQDSSYLTEKAKQPEHLRFSFKPFDRSKILVLERRAEVFKQEVAKQQGGFKQMPRLSVERSYKAFDQPMIIPASGPPLDINLLLFKCKTGICKKEKWVKGGQVIVHLKGERPPADYRGEKP